MASPSCQKSSRGKHAQVSLVRTICVEKFVDLDVAYVLVLHILKQTM